MTREHTDSREAFTADEQAAYEFYAQGGNDREETQHDDRQAA